MNRILLTFLFVGLAASASVETNEKQARSLLTRYYNIYKELVKDGNFPDSMNREDLLLKLNNADPKARAALQSQFRQRSKVSPMKALENVFRNMAEEQDFTEEELRALAEKMIAEGEFPDLREMNKA